jgi:hypothetical protein
MVPRISLLLHKSSFYIYLPYGSILIWIQISSGKVLKLKPQILPNKVLVTPSVIVPQSLLWNHRSVDINQADKNVWSTKFTAKCNCSNSLSARIDNFRKLCREKTSRHNSDDCDGGGERRNTNRAEGVGSGDCGASANKIGETGSFGLENRSTAERSKQNGFFGWIQNIGYAWSSWISNSYKVIQTS